MKVKQIFEIVDIIADNMLTDVHTEDGKQKCKEDFKIWLNLSWLGGIIEMEDLHLVKAYGESKIDELYKKFC